MQTTSMPISALYMNSSKKKKKKKKHFWHSVVADPEVHLF